MGLFKKKEKKVVDETIAKKVVVKKAELPPLPPPPKPPEKEVVSEKETALVVAGHFVVSMQGSTTLNVDEKGLFCPGVFETAEPLEPEAWRELVSLVNKGAVLQLVVYVPGEADGVEETNND